MRSHASVTACGTIARDIMAPRICARVRLLEVAAAGE